MSSFLWTNSDISMYTENKYMNKKKLQSVWWFISTNNFTTFLFFISLILGFCFIILYLLWYHFSMILFAILCHTILILCHTILFHRPFDDFCITFIDRQWLSFHQHTSVATEEPLSSEWGPTVLTPDWWFLLTTAGTQKMLLNYNKMENVFLLFIISLYQKNQT